MQTEPEENTRAYRISLPMPKDYTTYHQKLARAHPLVSFEVLRRTAVDEHSLEEEVRASGKDIPHYLEEEFRNGRGVRTVDIVETTSRYRVYRVIIDMPPLAVLVRELRIIVHYPIPFTDATARFLVAAPEEGVVALVEKLKLIAPDTSMELVPPETILGPKALLSPRQAEIFRDASTHGYWGIPATLETTSLATRAHEPEEALRQDLFQIEDTLLHGEGYSHPIHPETYSENPA